MKTYRVNDLLDMLYKSAVEDCVDAPGVMTTGWAQLGNVRCAYYPNSKRHQWFIRSGSATLGGVTALLDVLLYELNS